MNFLINNILSFLPEAEYNKIVFTSGFEELLISFINKKSLKLCIKKKPRMLLEIKNFRQVITFMDNDMYDFCILQKNLYTNIFIKRCISYSNTFEHWYCVLAVLYENKEIFTYMVKNWHLVNKNIVASHEYYGYIPEYVLNRRRTRNIVDKYLSLDEQKSYMYIVR